MKKKPYGKHLRFYSGNSLLDENKNKIENTDTTRVFNIFYCDSFGNLQWNILLSYNSREIQTLYLPPISELIINDYNSCFSLLLADTIGFQNKDGEYYYVYEHNPFSKRYYDSTLVYGKFKINNKEKVPYGTHFRFYRNVNTDEFRHAITLDSLRIAGMDYYDNVGKLYKSISIYYTSRKVQSVSLY